MSKTRETLSILISSLICTCLISDGAKVTDETRLYKELFENYNKYNHPVVNASETVKVVFDFQLIRIIDVSAKDQYIMTYAWVNQYWNNPQLTWDPDQYGGIKEIHVRPLDVWVPDILLYNNVDQEDRFAGGKHTYKTNVAMKHDGNTTWLNPALFKSICKVDVTYFPFDDQECFLKFGSWSFDSSKLDLYAHGTNMKNMYYVENGEWKLTLLEGKRNQLKYQCCAHAFVDVTVHIKIQRQSLDFVLKLIIPCSLISSMIFLGFVLPPESGERIGLSITVLLAMTVFQQLSSELMPSYGFPLLGQYYFATMIEIGASLVVTTLILNFYHRNNRRMPKPLRILILRWLARIVFPTRKRKDWNQAGLNVEASNASYRSGSEQNLNQSSDSENGSVFHVDSFQNYERKSSPDFSDPWVPMQRSNDFANSYDLPRNGKVYQKTFNGRGMISGGGRQTAYDKRTTQTSKKTRRKTGTRSHQCKRHQAPAKKESALPPSLPLDLFHNDTSTELSPKKLKNQKEWIKAARILDRLFLILSAMIGVLTLFALFLKAPRFHPS